MALLEYLNFFFDFLRVEQLILTCKKLQTGTKNKLHQAKKTNKTNKNIESNTFHAFLYLKQKPIVSVINNIMRKSFGKHKVTGKQKKKLKKRKEVVQLWCNLQRLAGGNICSKTLFVCGQYLKQESKLLSQEKVFSTFKSVL